MGRRSTRPAAEATARLPEEGEEAQGVLRLCRLQRLPHARGQADPERAEPRPNCETEVSSCPSTKGEHFAKEPGGSWSIPSSFEECQGTLTCSFYGLLWSSTYRLEELSARGKRISRGPTEGSKEAEREKGISAKAAERGKESNAKKSDSREEAKSTETQPVQRWPVSQELHRVD